MKIPFAVENEVTSHGIKHRAVTMNPQCNIAWTQILLFWKDQIMMLCNEPLYLECSMFYEIYVWLPNISVVVNAIKVCVSVKYGGQ